MPGQGEQHYSASAANPFEEVKPRISEYTATELATLSSRLEKQLGPEYISARPGAGGGKVHYLAADKCINLANQVFGFNGWSSTIQQIDVDFVDENQATGRVSLGLSVIVRVTLRDGTFHEDIGYGHIENCKGKAPAFEKAKKEGTTDGLKRALRNFGNLLGNCVYDKEYVAKVTKIKCAPTKWDPENLYRHHDFAPIKKENLSNGEESQPSLPLVHRELPLGRQESHEDEFGSDDFDEVDFAVPQDDDPDGVTIDQKVNSEHFHRRNNLPHKGNLLSDQIQSETDGGRFLSRQMRSTTASSVAAPQTPTERGPADSNTKFSNNQRPPLPPFPQQPSHLTPLTNTAQYPNAEPMQHQSAQPSTDQIPTLNSSNSSGHEPPVGFYTARAAETLQNAAQAPLKAPAFNPRLESPSIRKTAGIDHTKTKPVNRDLINAPSAMPSPPQQRGSNIVNPQADRARKVGMPGAPSPLQNRGSYRPPQMKRPVDMDAPARPALDDVTNASINVPSADKSGDVKRQRIEVEGSRAPAGVLNA